MKRNDDAKTVGMHPRAIVVEVLYEDWNHRRILTRRSDSRAVDVSVASRWEPESDAEVIAWLERNELPSEIMTAPLPLCASEKVIEEETDFVEFDGELIGCCRESIEEDHRADVADGADGADIAEAEHSGGGEKMSARNEADVPTHAAHQEQWENETEMGRTTLEDSISTDKEVGP